MFRIRNRAHALRTPLETLETVPIMYWHDMPLLFGGHISHLLPIRWRVGEQKKERGGALKVELGDNKRMDYRVCGV